MEASGNPIVYFVLNGGNIYWASPSEIGEVSTEGGPGVILASDISLSYVSNGAVGSNCIAVDSTSVYFGQTDGLYSVAK